MEECYFICLIEAFSPDFQSSLFCRKWKVRIEGFYLRSGWSPGSGGIRSWIDWRRDQDQMWIVQPVFVCFVLFCFVCYQTETNKQNKKRWIRKFHQLHQRESIRWMKKLRTQKFLQQNFICRMFRFAFNQIWIWKLDPFSGTLYFRENNIDLNEIKIE